jgi:asparagine synthase (glutamine-hydrolysing)
MCGICGVVGPPGQPVDMGAIRRMRDALSHRGPDGGGEAKIGGSRGDCSLEGWLGHRRLRVIDLTEAAHQPMTNERGSVCLVYNGEIYNFRELRHELEGEGWTFRSSGDTEVVLRAYEQWGDGFLSHLDGMFALAVWDSRRDHLLLARDRTGKKPLFYTTHGGRLTFASEIKGLLAAPWVPAVAALDLVPEFLTFGYAPGPATMFEGISQVPPASSVSYGPDGLAAPVRYWSPLPQGDVDLAPASPVHGIRRLLRAAVERRMVADVPVGAFLSGGVDSSIVVGLMAELSDRPVHTFSIGFPEDGTFDERPFARLVADRFGTHHTEFSVEADAVALLDDLLWHHDQPFADSSAIPTYALSRLASEHVRVVLNGDGGDEVFGGYDRFRAARIAQMLPQTLGRFGAVAARALPQRSGYYSVGRRAQRFFELSSATISDQYQSWVSVFPAPLVHQLTSHTIDLSRSMGPSYERAHGQPLLDQILMANFETYLPDDLAVKVDRMSMAHSLEARSPFLDTALIEFMSRVPARSKVGLRQVKPLLRQAFEPLLPKLIWSRKKHGFGVPMNMWFQGPLAEVFEDEVLASDARTSAILDLGIVAQMYRDHRSGARFHGPRLWTILTLERWLRAVERPWPTAPPRVSAIGLAS